MAVNILKMAKVKIDKERCLVCGLCQQFYPEAFRLGNGASEPIEGINPLDGRIENAINTCPVNAIYIED